MPKQAITQPKKVSPPKVLDRQPAQSLLEKYNAVRGVTEGLCAPLEVEDFVIQSMPDASPTKWHLAHTSWFFEIFVLQEAIAGYKLHIPEFAHLFNSYYNTLGRAFPRSMRGVLSRPTVKEIFEYRHHVDRHMRDLLASCKEPRDHAWSQVAYVGLQHEQQHQELLLTDIKHAFSCNPLYPTYCENRSAMATPVEPIRWIEYEGGLHHVGAGTEGFSFDSERPRHQAYIQPFQLADRLITNGEYMAFIADGGYENPQLWLSDGWDTVQREHWDAPLYWKRSGDEWLCYTLAGIRSLTPAEPVCHVSYYEADAYARWAGAYLPYEHAWELAANEQPIKGNFSEAGIFHPMPAEAPDKAGTPRQMFGDAWEWTASPYAPYPSFQPLGGALGEYNGKFMCNQMVLRGGSCATSVTHIRSTYRNFFPLQSRWQFSGIRLAK